MSKTSWLRVISWMAMVVFLMAVVGCSANENNISLKNMDCFGGTSWDSYEDIAALGSGYVAAGFSQSTDVDAASLNARGLSDALVVKYSNGLEQVWAKFFGGSGHDVFNAVASAKDGGVFAAGYSYSTDGDLSVVTNHGEADALLVKFDKDGKALWVANFGGTKEEAYHGVAVTDDGGCIAVGRTESSDDDVANVGSKGDYDALIVKYDSKGTTEWATTFGGAGRDEFTALAIANDGSITAVGFVESTDGDLVDLTTSGGRDAVIVKYNSKGGQLWKQVFGGSGSDEFNGVAITKDKGFLAVGSSNSEDGGMGGLGQGGVDGVAVKFDGAGTLIWKNTYGGTEDDQFLAVSPAGSDFILSGYTKSTDGNLTGEENEGSYDAMLVKFASSGEVKWGRTFGGSSWDRLNGAVKGKGGYVTAGSSFSNDGDMAEADSRGNYDAIILKYQN